MGPHFNHPPYTNHKPCAESRPIEPTPQRVQENAYTGLTPKRHSGMLVTSPADSPTPDPQKPSFQAFQNDLCDILPPEKRHVNCKNSGFELGK